MWTHSIGGRVKKVIKARVAAAQKEHDEMRERLEAEKQKAIDIHAEQMVKKVIGI